MIIYDGYPDFYNIVQMETFSALTKAYERIIRAEGDEAAISRSLKDQSNYNIDCSAALRSAIRLARSNGFAEPSRINPFEVKRIIEPYHLLTLAAILLSEYSDTSKLSERQAGLPVAIFNPRIPKDVDRVESAIGVAQSILAGKKTQTVIEETTVEWENVVNHHPSMVMRYKPRIINEGQKQAITLGIPLLLGSINQIAQNVDISIDNRLSYQLIGEKEFHHDASNAMIFQ